MSANLPIKSSSRAGRFKKKLVSESELHAEAPFVLAKVTPFQKLLSGSDFVAAYILTYLSHRYPNNWLGSKKNSLKVSGVAWRDLPFTFEPNILKRLEGVETLNEIFANFALKSTPESVNRAVLEWSAGRYGLELMFRIPYPAEVLKQQKMGRRCVTAIVDQRLSTYILGERDALSFIMHDLIHADHFYYHNECFLGQLGFYGLLDKTIGHFDLSNEAFASEFEYLIADMNAYAVHLLKCLKSAMIHYFSEDYFRGWAQGLNPPVALYALNTPAYVPVEMDPQLLAWLDQYRQS